MSDETMISVRIDTETLEKIQQFANRSGISRHKMLLNLIYNGVDALEELDKIGVLRMAIMTRHYEDSVAKAFGCDV